MPGKRKKENQSGKERSAAKKSRSLFSITSFLPATMEDAHKRGWQKLDVVLITGDAHVDHPSFPASLLGRVLEADGLRVGIISRPDVGNPESIAVFGLPRLFFGVTAGAMDSMVANYTASKRRRSDDPYAPGGKAGGRPDRALTVYCNLIRKKYGKEALIIGGGLEASLRRFAHYDYWSDSVRRPILMDCGADALVFGMGEGPVLSIAHRLAALLDQGEELAGDRELQLKAIREVSGVVWRQPKSMPEPVKGLCLPSAEEVATNPVEHANAFHLFETHREECMWQECGGMRVVANTPWPSHDSDTLDRYAELPFTRLVHPSIAGQPVPALEQVRFSITSHRGCAGGCAFCAISAHQGRDIQNRSQESILREARAMGKHPDFRGVINDLGGPTANMYGASCARDKKLPCRRTSCLSPSICKNLNADARQYLDTLKAVRNLPGVNHLFVTTGIRMDLAMQSKPLVKELAFTYTSGHLKVAPEHTSPEVLALMRKPAGDDFQRFVEMHRELSAQVGRKTVRIALYDGGSSGFHVGIHGGSGGQSATIERSRRTMSDLYSDAGNGGNRHVRHRIESGNVGACFRREIGSHEKTTEGVDSLSFTGKRQCHPGGVKAL